MEHRSSCTRPTSTPRIANPGLGALPVDDRLQVELTPGGELLIKAVRPGPLREFALAGR